MLQILLTFSLIFSAFLQPVDPEDEAQRLLNLLAQGQFEAVTYSFNATMRERIPAARLKAIWDESTASYGAFQEVLETRVEQVGEYTAVNMRSQFAAAVVNVRLVFNQQGQVSGFFLMPLEVTGSVSPLFTAALVFSALFAFLFPLALAVLARRRLGVSWKYFFYGVGIFVLFQLVTRIPLVSMAQAFLGPYISGSTLLMAAWLVVLSLSAGVFEEIGRYVGYRWLMPNDPKTWGVAVMFGLGHGGIEAMVLVGLNNLVGSGLILAFDQIRPLLPPEASAPILQQMALYASAPAWLPLLAAWERLWTIFFHVALSVLVLQVFRRGSLRWLWLAIGLHAAGNILAAGLPSLLPLETIPRYLLSSALVAALGLFALWIIAHFRRAEA